MCKKRTWVKLLVVTVHSPLFSSLFIHSSQSTDSFFIFSYRFFTKGKQRNHFCPCSTTCIDPAHSGENTFAQWNGKNIKKMAKGHKVVYIYCTVNKIIKAVKNRKRKRLQSLSPMYILWCIWAMHYLKWRKQHYAKLNNKGCHFSQCIVSLWFSWAMLKF